MGDYQIRVSVEILDNDHKQLYRYSELLRTGGQIQHVKNRSYVDNIVRTMAKDVRKMCLVAEPPDGDS